MAGAVKEKYGIEVELIPGDGGVFLVELDGRAIFQRRLGVKIPEPEGMVALVAECLGG